MVAGKLPAHHPGGQTSSMWKTVLKGLLKATWNFLQVLNPPGSFTTRRRFFGVTFPRKIQASAWATKHGLAGSILEEIRLHEFTWQGSYVSINFSRSIKEATFISYLLQHLRQHKLDLDQIAECFCADSGIQVSSEPPEHSKKTFRMKELAQRVVKQLQPYQTAELADAQDRIKELERQLAQQRKRTHAEAAWARAHFSAFTGLAASR